MFAKGSCLILLIFSFVRNYLLLDLQDAVLSQPEFPIEQYVTGLGYPFESHEVETEDGYLITLHRIPYGKLNSNQTNRTPVIIMHGLLGTSENFVVTYDNKSLGFLAADSGYDVWLPNARGSMHSRKHKTLNPDKDDAFWDFSWHEIGIYDMPAAVDLILNKTGQPDLEYIGHSLGGTVLIVMATEKPEYKHKIKSFIGLAPAVFMMHFEYPILKELLYVEDNVYDTMLLLKEILTFVNNQDLRIFAAKLGIKYPNVYLGIMQYLFGESEEISKKNLLYVSATFPSGGTAKEFVHYSQGSRLRSFRQFDYGPNENMKRYNNTLPPLYDLEHMDIPTYIFSGQNDLLVTMEDTETLIKVLPNVKEHHIIPAKKFTHFDFILSKNVDKLVNIEVLKILDRHRK